MPKKLYYKFQMHQPMKKNAHEFKLHKEKCRVSISGLITIDKQKMDGPGLPNDQEGSEYRKTTKSEELSSPLT